MRKKEQLYLRENEKKLDDHTLLKKESNNIDDSINQSFILIIKTKKWWER